MPISYCLHLDINFVPSLRPVTLPAAAIKNHSLDQDGGLQGMTNTKAGVCMTGLGGAHIPQDIHGHPFEHLI